MPTLRSTRRSVQLGFLTSPLIACHQSHVIWLHTQVPVNSLCDTIDADSHVLCVELQTKCATRTTHYDRPRACKCFCHNELCNSVTLCFRELALQLPRSIVRQSDPRRRKCRYCQGNHLMNLGQKRQSSSNTFCFCWKEKGTQTGPTWARHICGS